MKIAVDIRSLQNQQLTGVGLYLKNALIHLLSLDQKNKYILIYAGYRPINQAVLNALAGFNNLEYFKINWPNKLLNLSLAIFNYPRFDKFVLADLFWFANLNFYSLSLNMPAVLTIHDLAWLRYPRFFSKKMRLAYWWMKPTKKLQQARKIIAVSNSTKRDLIELINLPADKIEVIYPGLSPEQQPTSANIMTKHDLPAKWLLFLGTLEPRKNISAVISAFEKITDPDLHLVIAGGSGWLYQKMFQQAKRSPKKELIKFINYIEPAEINSLYSLAKMLVWPSYYEGFGFPPLEALAAGTPVIAGANSAMGEVLQNSALLADPYNVNDLAEAIKQLSHDSQLKNNFLTKAEKILPQYNWQTAATKILSLFKNTQLN